MKHPHKKTASFKTVVALLLVNLLFSTVSIAVKYTSMQQLFSMRYFIGVIGVIAMLGTYAIVWQQILKRVDMTLAYMFKAMGIIYVLLYSVFLFGETITVWNIIGAAIIVTGIVLFVKS
jgi:drug/metabolite transporter (DMT)-like permease